MLDLGGKLIKNQDVDPKIVIRFYEAVLKAYPDFSYAKSDLAAMYNSQGMTEKALPFFRDAYLADTKDTITLLNYVNALVYQEQFEEAYKLSASLSLLVPHSYYLTGVLGVLIGKSYKELFEKYAEIRKKEVKDPKADFWYTNALEFATFESKKQKDKVDYLEYLMDNFNQGNMSVLMIAAGSILLKIEPTNFDLLLLASAYDKNMNIDKTLKYLNLISNRRKTDSTIISEYDLYSNYARIYLVKDKFSDAEVYLLKTKGMKENDAKLNHYLGLCELGQGRKERAAEYFALNKKMNDKAQMEWINQSIWKLKEIEGKK